MQISQKQIMLSIEELKNNYSSKIDVIKHELSQESLTFLRSLPKEIRLTEQGTRTLMTHGSPASNSEHLSPSTSEERMRELAGMVEVDLMDSHRNNIVDNNHNFLIHISDISSYHC